jgi:hypothetical protein
MKWTTSKKPAVKPVTAKQEEKLVSKTVLDDLLSQISGGLALAACHDQA